MRFLFKILAITLLSLFIATEAQFVLFVFDNNSALLEDIELADLGGTESGEEEKADDSSEEVEKFFAAHQFDLYPELFLHRGQQFFYNMFIKANLHFEVISPPPQLLLLAAPLAIF